MSHLIPPRLLEHPVSVDLVGMGGTGSQMLTGLARLHLALLACGHPGGLQVHVYDPDRVSEANVGRQLYYDADVGRHKALVLVHRVNCCFGLDWDAYPWRWEARDDDYRRPMPEILITCVDSAAARRTIHLEIQSKQTVRPVYWLDLGNRETDGQVILGQPLAELVQKPNRNGRHDPVRLEERQPKLPTVVEVFPGLLDESLPEDDRPSCSLAEALESQDLFINQAVATLALNLLWTLFRRGKIEHHGYFINLATGHVAPLLVLASEKPKKRRKARE